MKKGTQYSISEEIKHFTLQNGIEISLLGIILILAGVGYNGQRWAAIIYMCALTILTLMFIFSLFVKCQVDPSVIYYSIYFLNLLVCVAFAWWGSAVCWAVILVCAGIGMDRYLKSEKNKEIKKDENKI